MTSWAVCSRRGGGGSWPRLASARRRSSASSCRIRYFSMGFSCPLVLFPCRSSLTPVAVLGAALIQQRCQLRFQRSQPPTQLRRFAELAAQLQDVPGCPPPHGRRGREVVLQVDQRLDR